MLLVDFRKPYRFPINHYCFMCRISRFPLKAISAHAAFLRSLYTSYPSCFTLSFCSSNHSLPDKLIRPL